MEGDCGSIVVDQESYEIYGHIIGSNPLNHALVVPLIDTIEQLKASITVPEIHFPPLSPRIERQARKVSQGKPPATQISPAEEFKQWARSHSIMEASPHKQNGIGSFIPEMKLYEYFEYSATGQLLIADLSQSSAFPAAFLTDSKQYLKVLAILTMIDQATRIYEFVGDESLSDSSLPFYSLPANFPDKPEATGLFQAFYAEQWRFCPFSLSSGVFNQKIEDQLILPITQSQLLSQCPAARIYKVRVHRELNRLRESEEDCEQAEVSFIKLWIST